MAPHALDAAEALTNASIGLAVSWAATFALLPLLWGLTPSVGQSAAITSMFFGLSLARNWAVRACFRRFSHAR